MAWLGRLGITLDIIGFVILANEWRKNWSLQRGLLTSEGFQLGIWGDNDQRPFYVAKDLKTKELVVPGSKAEYDLKTKLLMIQNADFASRWKLFVAGVALVVLGYLLQLLATFQFTSG